MSRWPFWGGLFALVIALAHFTNRSLDVAKDVAEKLLVIGTAVAILSHVLHHAGAPVPDLLPFLPSFSSLSAN